MTTERSSTAAGAPADDPAAGDAPPGAPGEAPPSRGPPGRAVGWLLVWVGGFMAGVSALVLLLQVLDPAAMAGGAWTSRAGAAVAVAFWCAVAGWGSFRTGRDASFVSGVLRMVTGVALFAATAAILVYALGLPGPGAYPDASAAPEPLPGLPAQAAGAVVALLVSAAVAAAAGVGRWWMGRGA